MGLYVSWAPITKKILYKGKSTLKEEDNEQQKKELTCVIIQKKERYIPVERGFLSNPLEGGSFVKSDFVRSKGDGYYI